MNFQQIRSFTKKLKSQTVMKHQTNRQVLSKAIKELSDIDLVFIRESLLSKCDSVLSNKEEVIQEMQGHIISPHLYIECMQNIKDKIDF